MACVLTIARDTTDYAVPLTTNGRLFVHTAGGGGFEALNTPGLPADQGGRLAIYRNGALAYSVPFTCVGAATKSGGSSGGVGQAGAYEGGVGSVGSSVGRLF